MGLSNHGKLMDNMAGEYSEDRTELPHVCHTGHKKVYTRLAGRTRLGRAQRFAASVLSTCAFPFVRPYAHTRTPP